MIEPGDTLYGYCGGAFGRDSYGEKTVIAVGRDWVLVRGGVYGAENLVDVYNGDPANLEDCLTPEPEPEPYEPPPELTPQEREQAATDWVTSLRHRQAKIVKEAEGA